MAFYFNSTEVMTLAMHKKMAMEMATQALEQSKSLGYGNPVLADTAGAWTPLTSVVFGSFSAQPQRRVTDNNPSANVKKIEIQVPWTESGKASQLQINLATYLAQ